MWEGGLDKLRGNNYCLQRSSSALVEKKVWGGGGGGGVQLFLSRKGEEFLCNWKGGEQLEGGSSVNKLRENVFVVTEVR